MSQHHPIQLRHVSVYQHKNCVLRDVTLELEKGEFAYLIGKTGSGKSSLLKTIYAELPLKEGDGEVAGFRLNRLRRKKIPGLRRKLGIVFQDFQLLNDRTVNENLFFVMRATGWVKKSEMKQRCADMLKKVGLEGTGDKMPHQLSGGEQQRTAIARALINQPMIILADEPTGNLDPETSEEILHLLFTISQSGTAVLMATHDYTIMEKFPFRTFRCENGKVLEVSPAAAFNPLT